MLNCERLSLKHFLNVNSWWGLTILCYRCRLIVERVAVGGGHWKKSAGNFFVEGVRICYRDSLLVDSQRLASWNLAVRPSGISS